MVSALDSGLNGPGSSPGQGTVLCSWARHLTLGTGECTAGGNSVMDYHPIQGGVEILLVASCYGNWSKLWPDGPLGSYADLNFFYLPSKNF